MAEKWTTNDSAREMTRKYNQTAEELNLLTQAAIAINETYLVAQPSDFRIEDDPEEAEDGA